MIGEKKSGGPVRPAEGRRGGRRRALNDPGLCRTAEPAHRRAILSGDGP